VWEQAENGHVKHPFEPVVLIATLALIPVLIIEYDVSSGGWLTFAEIANWVIWAIFAAELAFTCTSRRGSRQLYGHTGSTPRSLS
jgi:cobalamin synthase